MILVPIGPGLLLERGAAASHQRMCDAAGFALPVTSAYRDPAEQARLRRLYELGQWPAFVARVEDSDHVKGLAVDYAGPALAWLEVHAAAHGWRRTDPRERWHYVYDPAADRHRNDPPREDDDMYSEKDRAEATLALASAGRVELNLYALSRQVKALADKVGAPVVDVDEDAIVRGVLASLTPQAIAAAIPPANAQALVDALAQRVAGAR